MIYAMCAMIGALIGAGVLLFGVSKVSKEQSTSQKPTKSITKWLFVTTQISALIWVFMSYGIAIYSMIELGQVYTLSEIADPAITTLLGTVALKTVGNIFEHNNGGFFGNSDSETEDVE